MLSSSWQEMIKVGLARRNGVGADRLESSRLRDHGDQPTQRRIDPPLFKNGEHRPEPMGRRQEQAATPSPPIKQRIPERSETTVNDWILSLAQEALRERLECAIPLLESIQNAMTVDQDANRSYPGTMTVEGWIGLLNQWEEQLRQIRKRQIFFAKPFFQDAWQRSEASNSPLAPVLQELVEMIECSLEVT